MTDILMVAHRNARITSFGAEARLSEREMDAARALASLEYPEGFPVDGSAPTELRGDLVSTWSDRQVWGSTWFDNSDKSQRQEHKVWGLVRAAARNDHRAAEIAVGAYDAWEHGGSREALEFLAEAGDPGVIREVEYLERPPRTDWEFTVDKVDRRGPGGSWVIFKPQDF
jgi:hypothetical protein